MEVRYGQPLGENKYGIAWLDMCGGMDAASGSRHYEGHGYGEG